MVAPDKVEEACEEDGQDDANYGADGGVLVLHCGAF